MLYTLRPAGISSWDRSQIVVESLAGGARTVLIEGGRDARYVPTGHLVHARDGTLLAQAFDLGQLTMRGRQIALVEGVQSTTITGASMFSMSAEGSLVYVPGGPGAGGLRRFVWVDRQAQETFVEVPPARYLRRRLSPTDGTRVTVEIAGDDGTSSIWVADTTRGSPAPVTAGDAGVAGLDIGRTAGGLWVPDGR